MNRTIIILIILLLSVSPVIANDDQFKIKIAGDEELSIISFGDNQFNVDAYGNYYPPLTGDGGSSFPKGGQLGDFCIDDSDCASFFCVDNICSEIPIPQSEYNNITFMSLQDQINNLTSQLLIQANITASELIGKEATKFIIKNQVDIFVLLIIIISFLVIAVLSKRLRKKIYQDKIRGYY